jgi:eukaryotic-like serine/threonine-protein kinase
VKLRLPEDRFEVLGEVGAGAMGAVWAARHKLLGKLVAVKVMHQEVAPGSEDYRRFLREARLYRLVKSSHVIELHEVCLVKGRPCLVMELVEGPSAGELVEAAPMGVPQALWIAEDVARALMATSKVGVVHRDIKPENVFVDARGHAKLGDFGISKELGSKSRLTEPGMTLGSLSYMSPEQIRGDVLDVRADMFSLGAAIYHLLVGYPRLLPDDIVRAYGLICEGPPDLATQRPDCPGSVTSLVCSLLAADREERPEDPGVLARELCALRMELYPGPDGERLRPQLKRHWNKRRAQGSDVDWAALGFDS